MVYFIKLNNYIKIGFSEDPRKRFDAIKVASPFEIDVICIVDGDRKLEKKLHTKFAEYRSRGEWFNECEDIQKYIDDAEDIKWNYGFGEDVKNILMPIRRMYIDSGMTYQATADILGVTKQAIPKMLERATNGTITINKLKELAEGMGHVFEYRLRKK